MTWNIASAKQQFSEVVRLTAEEPQAIYKWQRGQSLPSVDNLYALSALLQVPMNEIIIPTSHIVSFEQQAAVCCSGHFIGEFLQVQWAWQNFKTA